MRMMRRQTKQALPTCLFMTSLSQWKLLVVMHHGSMEIIKDTTEVFTTQLDQYFLTVRNMKEMVLCGMNISRSL